MCGLFSIYHKDEFNTQANIGIESVCQEMLDTLKHRGPDERNIVKMARVVLGHTRLSIIDLNSGSQPIFNESGKIAVILNGEIYNFQELRADLVNKGHHFKTRSDTEVIVHLYEEVGEQVFSYLNGMFAVVIYDELNNLLLAARDRVGEKPLYYCETEQEFILASEMKAILKFPGIYREIDPQAVALFLNSMYVPAPYSIFKNIKKLKPAHFLKIKNDQIIFKRYWKPEINIDWSLKEDQIKEEFLWLFNDSVKRRMITDVPLGVFLSGGIDSSAVTAFMARNSNTPIKTFSVGFSDEFDERPFARIIAERYHTKHTELLVKDRIEDVFDGVMSYFDEPFADSSAIPTFLVARAARQHVKVILTGDGGDELFAGYGSYLDQKYQTDSWLKSAVLGRLNKCSLHTLKYDFRNTLYSKSISLRPLHHWHWVRTIFTDKELKTILTYPTISSLEFFIQQGFSDVLVKDPLSQAYLFDINFYLPDDLLKKVDMASMLTSLECRTPFLDHRLIEFSLKIPPQLKVKNDQLKYLLKLALKEYLPPTILNRPKHGFGAPVTSWMRNQLKDMVMDNLRSGCHIETLIDKKVVAKMKEDFYSNPRNSNYRIAFKLWSLFVLEFWIRRYL